MCLPLHLRSDQHAFTNTIKNNNNNNNNCNHHDHRNNSVSNTQSLCSSRIPHNYWPRDLHLNLVSTSISTLICQLPLDFTLQQMWQTPPSSHWNHRKKCQSHNHSMPEAVAWVGAMSRKCIRFSWLPKEPFLWSVHRLLVIGMYCSLNHPITFDSIMQTYYSTTRLRNLVVLCKL